MGRPIEGKKDYCTTPLGNQIICSISLPKELFYRLNDMIVLGYFPNRSMGVRELLVLGMERWLDVHKRLFRISQMKQEMEDANHNPKSDVVYLPQENGLYKKTTIVQRLD